MAFGIYSGSQATWVVVLWSKYRRFFLGDMTSNSKPRSNAGKGILSVWNKMIEGTTWSIGARREAHFWVDRWTANDALLDERVIETVPSEMLDDRVSDYVTEAGGWDFGKF